MQLSIEPLIYIGIFVGIVFLVEGIYLMFFGKSISLNARVNRRLEMLEKGSTREEVMEHLRKEQEQHSTARNIPFYSLIAEKARKGNIAFAPEMLMAVMAGLCVVAFLALTLLTGAGFAVRLLVSIVFGIGAVYFWINKKAKQRLSMMEEQLPDAVDLMVRSLRVGHPLNSAINIVSKEVPDPLGTEFGFISDEAAYGRDVSEALRGLAERAGLQDMRFLAVAVAIQQKSGGNLAEILNGLSKVIRARFKLFRRVKAITAEARWSGVFLSIFPVLALIGINVAQPDYYADVKDSTMFIPAAVVVLVFLIVNVFFMRMMVNIKV